jgi:hypothetical protein
MALARHKWRTEVRRYDGNSNGKFKSDPRDTRSVLKR